MKEEQEGETTLGLDKREKNNSEKKNFLKEKFQKCIGTTKIQLLPQNSNTWLRYAAEFVKI